MQLFVVPLAFADSPRESTAAIERLVRQDRTMPRFGLIIGDKWGPLFESYKGQIAGPNSTFVGPDTPFLYWSASKLISAAIAADLVEKGKMSFHDTKVLSSISYCR